jgi:type II secretory pathway pseudopilin PulG
MIELIFAIVVMGIALMSAPMLITTATKSAQTAFQQESVAMTASHANALMSYAWDEQNTQSQIAGHDKEILHTDSTNTALNDRNVSKAGKGVERDYSLNIKASPPATFGPHKDKELNGDLEPVKDKDDIDDFDGTHNALLIVSGSSASTGGYMDTSNIISTSVKYGGDNANYSACATSTGCAFSKPFGKKTPAGKTSNIKHVVVDLNSSNTDTHIRMKFFMCNIGASTPKTGTF